MVRDSGLRIALQGAPSGFHNVSKYEAKIMVHPRRAEAIPLVVESAVEYLGLRFYTADHDRSDHNREPGYSVGR